MHEAGFNGATTGRESAIQDWMIQLLDDDRVAEYDVTLTFSPGLHWMYRASLIRPN